MDLSFILLLGVRSKHYGTGYIGKVLGLGILDVLKQLADYDISAQTVRKIEQKYFKNWF